MDGRRAEKCSPRRKWYKKGSSNPFWDVVWKRTYDVIWDINGSLGQWFPAIVRIGDLYGQSLPVMGTG
jgi:hypothetical protein